jgi:hypothetical protein
MGIYDNFVIPYLVGLVLTVLKLITDRKRISTEEANSAALDLVLVSIGVLAVYSTTQGYKTYHAIVGNAVLGVVLLYIRAQRAAERDTVTTSGGTLKPVSLVSAAAQIVIGTASIYWTVRPV